MITRMTLWKEFHRNQGTSKELPQTKTIVSCNEYTKQRPLMVTNQEVALLQLYHPPKTLDQPNCLASSQESWRVRALFHKSQVDLARVQKKLMTHTTIKTSSIKKSESRARDKVFHSISHLVYYPCRIRIDENQVKIQWRSRRLETLPCIMMSMLMRSLELQALTRIQTKRCFLCRTSNPYWQIVLMIRELERLGRAKAQWIILTTEVSLTTWFKNMSLSQGCTTHLHSNILTRSMCKVCRARARREEPFKDSRVMECSLAVEVQMACRTVTTISA